ncbi:MAG: NaeI family type II restriction endonuclease [Marmoricola sp.]
MEINFRREFSDLIDDGAHLDYLIEGEEVDCKYSQSMGGWMLPPECFDKLLLVATSSDESGTWSLGTVRAIEANRRPSSNRDGKTGLNQHGRTQIRWIWLAAPLPPNILLTIDNETLTTILSRKPANNASLNCSDKSPDNESAATPSQLLLNKPTTWPAFETTGAALAQCCAKRDI